MEQLLQRIAQGDVIILDGGTATELDRRGVPMHGVAWSAAALRTHPSVVRQVHEDYIRAGADVIITNTFSSARHTLERTELAEEVRDLNTRAVHLAKEACESAAGDRRVYVAGSMSTAFRPDEEPSAEYMKSSYREQAHVLAEAGAELLVMEMMIKVDQATYAIEAAVSTGLPIWVGYSCKMSEDGSQVVLLRSEGETFAQALEILLPLGGSLVSVMHSNVEDTAPALRVLQDQWNGPLGAYPESGKFVKPNWQFDEIVSPEELLGQAKQCVQMGVQLIGGCCGTGPEHIRVLKEGLPVRPGPSESPR